jgi:hypothetical protein
MKFSSGTIRGWAPLGALILWAGVGAWGQDSSGPPLGDVARKTRKERAATDHPPAKGLVNEEEDGPDTTGVWRVRLCSRTPCYELSISLPKSPKWTRAAEQPRPALIPLPGPEEDSNRVIRIYVAESLEPTYSIDGAKRTFLQGWFARPEYFGRAAHIVLDEHTLIDSFQSVISHFTVAGDAVKYRGLSVVSSTPNGNYGFACVYRDQDSAAAANICDAVVKSARGQMLEASRPRVYPAYQEPQPYDPQYYPQHDPREDEDPE